MLRRVRIVLWVACAIPLLALGAVGILEITQRNGGVEALPGAGIGGPFKLASSTGGELSSDELKGKPFVVFFGFTRCPEICPTTVSDISTWLDALGPDGKEIKALFISIDPERDDVASLKDYLSSFNDRIVGLTGTPDQIAAVAKEYRVYYKKVPLDGGDYTMDHTAIVYLMDKDGRFVAPFSLKRKPDAAAAELRKYL